jgi:hypothetical protein
MALASCGRFLTSLPLAFSRKMASHPSERRALPIEALVGGETL